MVTPLIRFTWKKLTGAAIVLTILGSAAAAAAQTYQLNDTGSAVEAIQRRLRISVDGVYGAATESEVLSFQSRNNLRCQDGLAGPETLRALGLEYLITDPSGGCAIAASPSYPGNGSAGRSAPYVVVVPGSDQSLLNRVRRFYPAARLARSRIGSYINAGSSAQRRDAEIVSSQLRRRGFDARVAYRP